MRLLEAFGNKDTSGELAMVLNLNHEGNRGLLEKCAVLLEYTDFVQDIRERRRSMAVDDAYFKIGLLDSTYSIANDGEKMTVWHPGTKQKVSPIIIRDSIGICAILSVYYDKETNRAIVIERNKCTEDEVLHRCSGKPVIKYGERR